MLKEGIESVSLPLDLSAFSEIIDVRSPDEFAEDHLPDAINLPVLDNAERAEVGTLYQRDPFAARRLGAACISRNVARFLDHQLADRARDWAPLICCWRGGMRSASMALILRSIGWRARTLEGGYKAWRAFLREDLERLLQAPDLRIHVLAGLTGSGKTRLLHALREAGGQVLDLEGLANHRGSLLGTVGPQPSQKAFESGIHACLRGFDLSRPIFVEAESNRIGSVHIPDALWQGLRGGVVHEVTLPLEERAAYLLEDYEHFPRSPEELTALLEVLRRLRGHAQVDEWQEMIRRNAWPEFVRSILVHHYDLAYRRPGDERSVYQSPSDSVDLPDASPGTLRTAAERLFTSLAIRP